MNSPGEKGTDKNKGKLILSFFLLLFWMIISLPSEIFTSQGLTSLLEHLLVGIPLVFLVYRLCSRGAAAQTEASSGLPGLFRLFVYIFYLIKEIMVAGVDVARRVMRRELDISPGMIKVNTPLRDDMQITLNANSITLTPGTITVDIEPSDNGCIFWVHCISQEAVESVRKDKGFVKKIQHIYE